jgi:UPF0755 protein
MRVLASVFLLGLVAAAVAAWEIQRRWEQPLAIPQEGYTLDIVAGDSLYSVARRLRADGVLEHPWLLRLYGRWTGLDQQLRRGEYRVPAGTDARSLLLLLRSGKVIQYQVTLPEGITLARALEILADQESLLHELDGDGDQRLVQLAQPHASAEGLFLPETYRYQRGASDWDILRRAHRALQEELETQWQQRAEGLPYDSPYDALIMASIIERETGLPEERGQIAGVFTRRLHKGMRLQTDPTIIYGLGNSFDGNLTRRHLRDDSNSYNTYRHGGLPPTPIALPGRAAIRAALHPEPGAALYFVARGDGGHVFSASLAEHERAVRKYQLQRRQDYRSSPGNN